MLVKNPLLFTVNTKVPAKTLIATEIKTWKETAERAGLEPQ